MIRKTSKSRHLRRQLSPTLNVLLEYEPIIETLERKRDRAPQKEEKWVLNHNKFDLSRHLRRTVRTCESMQTFMFG